MQALDRPEDIKMSKTDIVIVFTERNTSGKMALNRKLRESLVNFSCDKCRRRKSTMDN